MIFGPGFCFPRVNAVPVLGFSTHLSKKEACLVCSEAGFLLLALGARGRLVGADVDGLISTNSHGADVTACNQAGRRTAPAAHAADRAAG